MVLRNNYVFLYVQHDVMYLKRRHNYQDHTLNKTYHFESVKGGPCVRWYQQLTKANKCLQNPKL